MGVAHYRESGYTVDGRKRNAQTAAADIGLLPLNRKGERRVQNHVKVVVAFGIFPEIRTADDDIFSKSLLKPYIVLISRCRSEWMVPVAATLLARPPLPTELERMRFSL